MSSHTEEIFQAVYDNILDGTFRPGEKLPIAKLAKMFDVTLSPVREALSRLSETNLVIAISQRGFKVAPLSLEDMNDVYTTRMHVEQVALRLSIEKGDDHWEANLLAAFHRLSKIEKQTTFHTRDEYKNWEKYHREFNLALIAACGLRHLLSIQEKIYMETERYRRFWFHAELKPKNTLQFSIKQKPIMDAAMARDAKRACDLLAQHFESAKKLIGLAFSHR